MMPLSKGKRYILTILDSFSRHLTAIPYARNRAIDASRGIYQFLLRHREMPCIVSSDRGTHFTSEVYKYFCEMTSVTLHLHCLWHYIITGRHSNIGLTKLPNRNISNDDAGAYGMLINALLRQVHQHVALANNEADHKTNKQLNRLIYKDPIQVRNKVLLHRPHSVTAHISYLHWTGSYQVIKTNDMVLQITNGHSETSWCSSLSIRRLVPRSDHLIYTNLTPPPQPTQHLILRLTTM